MRNWVISTDKDEYWTGKRWTSLLPLAKRFTQAEASIEWKKLLDRFWKKDIFTSHIRDEERRQS